MTAQERTFAREYAATGDATYAATQAHYASPATSSSRVLSRPAVQESIKRQQMARLNNELLPLALDTIEHVMTNPKATDSNKLTAAGLVMKYTAGANGEGDSKEPHEMSADELQQRIQALRREQAERAKPVIDVEPSSIDDQAGVFD